MAKRLVTLHFDDNSEIVMNFDHVMQLWRRPSPAVGTRLTFTTGTGIDVKEPLEQVLDLAEKA